MKKEKETKRRIMIKYFPFPEQIQGKVKGLSSARKTGNYLVLIDSTRAPIVQRKTLGHELAHISLGHLEPECKLDIDKIEGTMHQYEWKFYRLYKNGFLDDYEITEEHLSELP